MIQFHILKKIARIMYRNLVKGFLVFLNVGVTTTASEGLRGTVDGRDL